MKLNVELAGFVFATGAGLLILTPICLNGIFGEMPDWVFALLFGVWLVLSLFARRQLNKISREDSEGKER